MLVEQIDELIFEGSSAMMLFLTLNISDRFLNL